MDRYSVAVVKNDATATIGTTVVDHLSKKISKILSIFLRRGVTITCEVTWPRRYSRDLEQGGMEIPCRVMIKSSDKKEVEKCKELLQHRH